MPEYKITLVVEGQDRASGPLGKVGGALGNIAQYAIGDLLAGAIRTVGRTIGGLASEALEAVGQVQNLEMAMEGLLTESLMYQQVNEMKQVTISLTGKETEKLANLKVTRDRLAATIQKQEVELAEAAQRKNESEAHYQARLNKMQVTLDTNRGKLAQYTDQIAVLEGKQGRLATVTESSWQQVMDFGSASEIAAGQVADLLSFVEQVSIVSPFETDQVELVTKIGLASRLSADQVKEFTGAFLDYAAVHGITSSNLAFAAEQFLQLKQIGALTTIDLRQLRRLGIDVARIIGIDMSDSVAEATERFGDLSPAARQIFSGMMVDDLKEFNKQLKNSPEMLDAIFQKFILLSGETTAGAAERMSTTITGMMSTIGDVVTIGARKLFRPIVEAVSPAMAEVLGSITGFVTGGQLAEIGARVGEMAAGVVDWLQVKIPLAIETARGYWTDVLQPAIAQVWAFVRGRVIPLLMELSAWLRVNLPLAIETVRGYWTDILQPAIAQVWAFMRGRVIPLLMELSAWLRVNLPLAIETVRGYWTDVLQPAIAQVWAFVQESVIPVLMEVWAWLQVNIPLAIETARGYWTDVLQPAIAQVWAFVQESVIPLLIELWNWLQVNLPMAIENLSGFWTDTLQPALTQIWAFLQDYAVPILAGLAAMLLAVVVPAFATWAAGVISAAVAAGMALAAVVLPILAIGAAVGLLVAAWTKDWGGIRTFLTETWEGHILPTLKALWEGMKTVWEWLATNIPKAIGILRGFIEGYLLPPFQAVWGFISEYLIPLFTEVVGLVGDVLVFTFNVWAALLTNVVFPALEKVWAVIAEKLKPIFEALHQFWVEKFKPALDVITNMLGGLLFAAIGRLMARMMEFRLKTLIPLKLAFEAIKKIIKIVIDVIAKMRDALAKIDLPDWLKPGSPPPLALGLEDIAAGMRAITRIELPRFSTAMAGAGAGPLTRSYQTRQTSYYWQPTVYTAAPRDEAMRLNYQEMLAMTG